MKKILLYSGIILIGFTIAGQALAFDPTYRELVVSFSRDGTNPTSTIISNTLGFTPTFSYPDEGSYVINYSGGDLTDTSKLSYTGGCDATDTGGGFMPRVPTFYLNYPDDYERILFECTENPIEGFFGLPTSPQTADSFEMRYYDNSQASTSTASIGTSSLAIIEKNTTYGVGALLGIGTLSLFDFVRRLFAGKFGKKIPFV